MKKTINSIQGFRAIAIIAIFLSHTYTFLGEDYRSIYPILAKQGHIGVTAFFMLSGVLFVLKQCPIRYSETLQDRLHFSWTKVSKLYSLHIVTLFLAFIGKFPFTIKETIIDIFSLPFQLTLTQAWFPWVGVIDSFNGPSWFLSAMFGMWLLISTKPSFINSILKMRIDRVVSCLVALIVGGDCPKT